MHLQELRGVYGSSLGAKAVYNPLANAKAKCPEDKRLGDGEGSLAMTELIWGFPKIRGTIFGAPHDKDYSILGSTLGLLICGKLPSIPGITPASIACFIFLSI